MDRLDTAVDIVDTRVDTGVVRLDTSVDRVDSQPGDSTRPHHKLILEDGESNTAAAAEPFTEVLLSRRHTHTHVRLMNLTDTS